MITLASDFGSPYPAAMRGVVLQRSDARHVDVAHDLPRQDVRAGDHWLVGPDNGVLLPPARRLADGAGSGDPDVYEWRYEDPASSTFHGRDVFAPAAAAVHEADDPLDLEAVEPVNEHVDLAFPEPEVHEEGAIGEVLVVDGFGNVVTNVPGSVLDGLDELRVNGRPVPADRAYAAVDEGQWLATVGSHGNVELAVNRGRGDEAFGLAAGDDVALEWD